MHKKDERGVFTNVILEVRRHDRADVVEDVDTSGDLFESKDSPSSRLVLHDAHAVAQPALRRAQRA